MTNITSPTPINNFVIAAGIPIAAPSCRRRSRNIYAAFCTPGRWNQFHRQHCAVCEKPFKRAAENQQLCRRRKCRLELRRQPALYLPFQVKTSPTSSSVIHPLKSVHSAGLKYGHESGRAAWRIVAGPDLSETSFRLATLPLDPQLIARLDRKHADYVEYRRTAKRKTDRIAIIKRRSMPVNVLGGYRFPNAPDIDLSPIETPESGGSPVRLGTDRCRRRHAGHSQFSPARHCTGGGMRPRQALRAGLHHLVRRAEVRSQRTGGSRAARCVAQPSSLMSRRMHWNSISASSDACSSSCSERCGSAWHDRTSPMEVRRRESSTADPLLGLPHGRRSPRGRARNEANAHRTHPTCSSKLRPRASRSAPVVTPSAIQTSARIEPTCCGFFERLEESQKHMKNDDDEPKTVSPGDAADFGDLWLDPALGDGIVDVRPHNVPIGKPKDFFRVVPDPAYRRRTEAITIKPEGVIDEQHYIVAKPMRGRIEEARPCTLVTCIYRDGSLRLWPIALPKDGERDNEAWMSARAAAKIGMERWVKIVWVRRAYQTREAQPGYAPEPDYSKLPAFDDLVGLAYGATGVIRDTKHPVYRDLMGSAPVAGDADDDADL